MESKKHTLYIVGTPIGNLEDFTFRGVRVLNEAFLILSEDTRRALKLLNHYKIKKKIESFFEFNQKRKIEKIIEILKSKGDVAIISDAGMPLISDPGFPLIEAAVKEGVNIEVVPGASAVTASLVLSGFPVDRFYFGGFFPRKEKERNEVINLLKQVNAPSVFFESPKRIKGMLSFLVKCYGVGEVVLCRELTKYYQEIIRGSVSDVLEMTGKRELKGEITVVLSPVSASKDVADETDLKRNFDRLVEKEKLSKKDAVIILSDRFNISKRELYQKLMR